MNTFDGLFASRLFGCVGMSPLEALVTETVADIYSLSLCLLTSDISAINAVPVSVHGDYAF